MGTRSLTFVYSEYEENKPILNLYRQFDGYPTGHGKELAEFLGSGTRKIVNGYNSKDGNNFNGMGCLAAQMVAHFKKGIGEFYIQSVDSDDCGQDYVYKVYKDFVEVYRYNGERIFKGDYFEFTIFCNQDE